MSRKPAAASSCPSCGPWCSSVSCWSIFKKYQIEGRAFLAVVTLAFWALPVHYLAPYSWKKPLFVAVSIGGLFWVFGAAVTAIVLGLAAVLIGVCFLPLSWTGRAAWMAFSA